MHNLQARPVISAYMGDMEASLRSLLNWYERVGVETPDLPLARSVRRVRTKPVNSPVPPTPKPKQKTSTLDPAPIAAACKTIAELKAALDVYDAGALSDGARQVVLARGNPDAAVMVIGDAPNREDDQVGRPFVGGSGELLDRMLGAIGLGADDAYISNVCFWRPTNDRKPDAEELALCRPFVNRHIELAEPKIILLMGATALQEMTSLTGIMRHRGQWQSLHLGGRDIACLPIYHPTFLLSQPTLKADAWQDLLTLRQRLLDD